MTMSCKKTRLILKNQPNQQQWPFKVTYEEFYTSVIEKKSTPGNDIEETALDTYTARRVSSWLVSEKVNSTPVKSTYEST